MKTTIKINNLDVEFTDEVPTRAGVYWWTRRVGSESTSLHVKDIWNPCGEMLMDRITNKEPLEIGGLWSSTLVPVTEVEKAYDEGSNDTEEPLGRNAERRWEKSRAKRVVEGMT